MSPHPRRLVSCLSPPQRPRFPGHPEKMPRSSPPTLPSAHVSGQNLSKAWSPRAHVPPRLRAQAWAPRPCHPLATGWCRCPQIPDGWGCGGGRAPWAGCRGGGARWGLGGLLAQSMSWALAGIPGGCHHLYCTPAGPRAVWRGERVMCPAPHRAAELAPCLPPPPSHTCSCKPPSPVTFLKAKLRSVLGNPKPSQVLSHRGLERRPVV